MNRRAFLTTSAAAVGAVAVGPLMPSFPTRVTVPRPGPEYKLFHVVWDGKKGFVFNEEGIQKSTIDLFHGLVDDWYVWSIEGCRIEPVDTLPGEVTTIVLNQVPMGVMASDVEYHGPQCISAEPLPTNRSA